jgi:hypothetical protein
MAACIVFLLAQPLLFTLIREGFPLISEGAVRGLSSTTIAPLMSSLESQQVLVYRPRQTRAKPGRNLFQRD